MPCEELLRQLERSTKRPRSYQGVVDETRRKCEYVEVPERLAALVTAAVTPHVDTFFGIETYPVPGQPTLIYHYGVGAGFVAHHEEVTEVELERAATTASPSSAATSPPCCSSADLTSMTAAPSTLSSRRSTSAR